MGILLLLNKRWLTWKLYGMILERLAGGDIEADVDVSFSLVVFCIRITMSCLHMLGTEDFVTIFFGIFFFQFFLSTFHVRFSVQTGTGPL